MSPQGLPDSHGQLAHHHQSMAESHCVLGIFNICATHSACLNYIFTPTPWPEIPPSELVEAPFT